MKVYKDEFITLGNFPDQESDFSFMVEKKNSNSYEKFEVKAQTFSN